MTEKRISDLEALVFQADIIDADEAILTAKYAIGSTVLSTVEVMRSATRSWGDRGKPAEGLISNESPVGKALLGLPPPATRRCRPPRVRRGCASYGSNVTGAAGFRRWMPIDRLRASLGLFQQSGCIGWSSRYAEMVSQPGPYAACVIRVPAGVLQPQLTHLRGN